MISIKNLTVKNFMSVGNATQAVDFNRHDLTLVLGENLDLGGNGSRNGTGKTTIINALSYAFYGLALTNIKRDNLINKTNSKGMLVSVDFSLQGVDYRIERGRKPAVLKLFKNNEETFTDDAQGDSRETQKYIENLLGLSHDMFKHIIALNTYSEPFLSMRTKDQQAIIEQLLGITMLTEKAEILKEQSKEVKAALQQEEFRIKAIQDANERIKDQIDSLKKRQKLWTNTQVKDVGEMADSILKLEHIDIDADLKAFKDLEEYTAKEAKIDDCNKWITTIERSLKAHNRKVITLEKDIALLKDHKCHACGQDLHDDKQEENKRLKEDDLAYAQEEINELEEQELEHKQTLAEIGDLGEKPSTFYDSLAQALEHKNTLATIKSQMEARAAEVDPYSEQITEMEDTALQDVSYDTINDYNDLLSHQEFLHKLLVNKDSFIRKQIIEQNLAYLNSRLTHYLDGIGLRHQVKFLNDLSIEITDLGRDLDFDNLSRGERNRLILSLSWAFRDVWESLYSPINLLFIDELIDSGMDTQGVENSIGILKGMSRERNKSVWLVSHKEELIGRVHNTMTVYKENGFTTYNSSE
jgi:DNA repair exonuclease SbcCD ATPase subunit